MKNFILTSKKIVLLCFCLFTIFSCSEDLLEETTVRKSKEKPNLKLEFLSTKENPQLLEPFARKFPKKMKISTDSSGRQSRFGTLEGDFGTILLDQALEVNEGTYKTETYEVREKVDNPNLYYNVVVDKDEKFGSTKLNVLPKQHICMRQTRNLFQRWNFLKN